MLVFAAAVLVSILPTINSGIYYFFFKLMNFKLQVYTCTLKSPGSSKSPILLFH